MPLGEATPKSNPSTYFKLDTPEDFIQTLQVLCFVNYTGDIHVELDIHGQAVWRFTLSSTSEPGVNKVNALQTTLGEVLVWDGSLLKALTPAEFEAQYQS